MTRFLMLTLVLTGLLATSVSAEPGLVPVLTYHRFNAATARSATVVVTAVFEEQMAWLAANHYRVVKLRDVVDNKVAEGPAVAITADDGFRSVYTDMFPIIRRYQMPVTLFINPPMIGGGAYLTWAQIEEMTRSGLVDIEPHTQTHPNFLDVRAHRSPEDFRSFVAQQIGGSREALQHRLGTAADLLAWPYRHP